MDRRGFFECIGKMLMVGAVSVVAPEIMEPDPVEQCITDKEFLAIHYPMSKPDFSLAS